MVQVCQLIEYVGLSGVFILFSHQNPSIHSIHDHNMIFFGSGRQVNDCYICNTGRKDKERGRGRHGGYTCPAVVCDFDCCDLGQGLSEIYKKLKILCFIRNMHVMKHKRNFC